MSSSHKLTPGSILPELVVRDLSGNTTDIGKPTKQGAWKLLVVYRGKHCPICTKYLNQLESYINRLAAVDVEVAAVSADSSEQLAEHSRQLNVSYPIYHGLSVFQMFDLGLYVSTPRSVQETDHHFSEPGILVVNEEGILQIIDISNNPFIRSELATLVSGIEWIRKNQYPIRGTFEGDHIIKPASPNDV